jgi:hypothetical protein
MVTNDSMELARLASVVIIQKQNVANLYAAESQL